MQQYCHFFLLWMPIRESSCCHPNFLSVFTMSARSKKVWAYHPGLGFGYLPTSRGHNLISHFWSREDARPNKQQTEADDWYLILTAVGRCHLQTPKWVATEPPQTFNLSPSFEINWMTSIWSYCLFRYWLSLRQQQRLLRAQSDRPISDTAHHRKFKADPALFPEICPILVVRKHPYPFWSMSLIISSPSHFQFLELYWPFPNHSVVCEWKSALGSSESKRHEWSD